jgi:hypothetical protein
VTCVPHFVVQVTFDLAFLVFRPLCVGLGELTFHTGPQPGDMAGLNPREEAPCWADTTYAGACAAVGQGLMVASDLWVTCPACLFDTVFSSANEVLVQMPPDERAFHLADTLQSCAVVGRPAPPTVVNDHHALRHWAVGGRTRAPATYLILQRTADILRAVILVHLDGGRQVVFSAVYPLYAMHLGCSDRHYVFMSVTEVSVLVSSCAPHSGLLAGLGSQLAVLALSYVHRYMEDQRQQMYNNVYHRISMDVSDVKERWQDMEDDLECLIAQQEEQLNYPHAIAMGYVDNDLDEAIIRLGVDCRAMQWEAWSSEQIADSIHHDIFIQRAHAFYLCFAIGMPNPQGNKSDSAFFSAMGSCKHADCPCKRTRPGYRNPLQWVPGVGTWR